MRKLGMILIALGVVLTICAGGWLTWNEADERRADNAARTTLEKLAEQIEHNSAVRTDGQIDASTDKPRAWGSMDAPGSTEVPGRVMELGRVDTPADANMPAVVIDGEAFIGYLGVPELGLELPVRADCTEEGLKNSPCRYWGSLRNRDLVIAGHNYKRHFTPVKNLKPGAKILFRDAENRDYEFVVSAVETVAGTDVEAMIANSGDWDMTLFTCTYGGRDRVAIRCVRTDE